MIYLGGYCVSNRETDWLESVLLQMWTMMMPDMHWREGGVWRQKVDFQIRLFEQRSGRDQSGNLSNNTIFFVCKRNRE